MPWKVMEPMEQRAQFVALHQEQLYSMTELCQRFVISPKTGYKWLQRYQQQGLAGLADQSRAPKSCPHQMNSPVQQILQTHAGRIPPGGHANFCLTSKLATLIFSGPRPAASAISGNVTA